MVKKPFTRPGQACGLECFLSASSSIAGIQLSNNTIDGDIVHFCGLIRQFTAIVGVMCDGKLKSQFTALKGSVKDGQGYLLPRKVDTTLVMSGRTI